MISWLKVMKQPRHAHVLAQTQRTWCLFLGQHVLVLSRRRGLIGYQQCDNIRQQQQLMPSKTADLSNADWN